VTGSDADRLRVPSWTQQTRCTTELPSAELSLTPAASSIPNRFRPTFFLFFPSPGLNPIWQMPQNPPASATWEQKYFLEVGDRRNPSVAGPSLFDGPAVTGNRTAEGGAAADHVEGLVRRIVCPGWSDGKDAANRTKCLRTRTRGAPGGPPTRRLFGTISLFLGKRGWTRSRWVANGPDGTGWPGTRVEAIPSARGIHPPGIDDSSPKAVYRASSGFQVQSRFRGLSSEIVVRSDHALPRLPSRLSICEPRRRSVADRGLPRIVVNQGNRPRVLNSSDVWSFRDSGPVILGLTLNGSSCRRPSVVPSSAMSRCGR